VGLGEAELLRRAASLAALSTHPLSRALCEAAPPAGGAFVWHAAREQAGAGIEALDAEGRLWRLGAAAWAGGAHAPADDENLATCIGCDGRLLARFAFDETLAEGVAEAVHALQAGGVALTLLSGDTPARVRRLAQRLGMAEGSAIGGASPQIKLRHVQQAQARGECVGMVGDGINDAPVLARADVSLAMGEGALVARANADAVIVSNRLGDVVFARALAQRTLRVIRQNMAWAAGYNALCVPLALAGALPPWAAGLGMATSSLVVIGNSLRLQR
jgi:P-type Cu2+ transporter